MTPMMLEQLRYSGLLEVCTIRKMGFPIRRVFDEFLQRYGCISPSATSIDALLHELVQKVGKQEEEEEEERGLGLPWFDAFCGCALPCLPALGLPATCCPRSVGCAQCSVHKRHSKWIPCHGKCCKIFMHGTKVPRFEIDDPP